MSNNFLRDDATFQVPSVPVATTSVAGSVKPDGTTITVTGDGTISAVDTDVLTSVTNSLGADVALNNTGTYFDGPSCAQGISGTWLAVGTVTLIDTSSAVHFNAKLWDGTTVIASARAANAGASDYITISLSGVISSPAANIKISVQDSGSVSGKIIFNGSGNSKDSTLIVVRIA